ncbi:unnamed protein product [Rotaria sordida]|uniref:DUF1279 domain-containing protein n=1 Tax=Rotaria sordida TaxID=392033 RepID=A0A819AZP2_9BILA|nr:unnamed protein product [Rotaria sordida]CAF1244324.1 unnamed protein product [Rotaria sordida]CAF1278767.1 unnamed protein product [Rotaria sordida]CAF3549075.1 unnamed protein product [Rotaria sordida]CAF3699538.1 unnamed protein product [Rotaria sordida]
MWHLCRLSSRSLIRVCPVLIRQRPLIPIQPSTSQRLLSFPSFFKIKKHLPEPLPQPPFNPRHPPDYIPLRPPIDPNATKPVQSQSSIFARFHQAYAKYGKILLGVHFVSSFAWFSGLLLLHFNGFDLGMYVMDVLVKIHVISPERRLSFIRHMNEFSIAGVLSRIPFVSEERLNKWKAYWTGERLRLLATVLLLYKFLSPLRYAFTLGATTYISRIFLKRGFIKRAPQGDSLQELYLDQKLLIKSHVRRAREKIKKSARRGTHQSE